MLILLFALFIIGNVHSALHSNNAKELRCPPIQEIPTADPKSVDYKWMKKNMPYKYIPMASQYAARAYAESFLSRPVRNQQELHKMNFESLVVSAPNKLAFREYGYGAELKTVCAKLNAKTNLYHQHFCISTHEGTKKSDPPRIVTALYTLLWTDNKSTKLHTVCINGDILSWALWSKYEKISKRTKKIVLEKISAIGFDPTKVVYFPSSSKNRNENQKLKVTKNRNGN